MWDSREWWFRERASRQTCFTASNRTDPSFLLSSVRNIQHGSGRRLRAWLSSYLASSNFHAVTARQSPRLVNPPRKCGSCCGGCIPRRSVGTTGEAGPPFQSMVRLNSSSICLCSTVLLSTDRRTTTHARCTTNECFPLALLPPRSRIWSR